jgi:hypothetical protein
MQKRTVSLVGLMDLGTLDALKSITALKNPCLTSVINEPNSKSNLFNIEVPDKSGHLQDITGHSFQSSM